MECQLCSSQRHQKTSLKVQQKQQIIINVNIPFTKHTNRIITKSTHKTYSEKDWKLLDLTQVKKVNLRLQVPYELVKKTILTTYLPTSNLICLEILNKTPQFSAEKPFLTVQNWKLRMNIPINLEDKDFSWKKIWLMYHLQQKQFFFTYPIHVNSQNVLQFYNLCLLCIHKQVPSGKKKSS